MRELARSEHGEVVCRLEDERGAASVLLCDAATTLDPDGWAELYELHDSATLGAAERAAALTRLRDEVASWGGIEEAGVDPERQRPADTPPPLATLEHDDYLVCDEGPIAGVLYDAERGLHWAVRSVRELTLASVGLTSAPPPAPAPSGWTRLLPWRRRRGSDAGVGGLPRG